MAKRVVSASGEAKRIAEENGGEKAGMGSHASNSSSGGDGNKATLKDWLIVGGTILVIVLLLGSCVRSCGGGDRKDSRDEPEQSTNTDFNEQDTGESATQQKQNLEGAAEFDGDYALSVLGAFVEAYNSSNNVVTPISNEISLEDLDMTQKGHFQSELNSTKADDGLFGVYELGASGKDKLVVAFYTKDGVKRILVLGMYDKYEGTVDSFKNVFFIISDKTTADDFNKIVGEETFLYGGKDGESKGIVYEVGVWGGYHTIAMDTQADHLNFKLGEPATGDN